MASSIMWREAVYRGNVAILFSSSLALFIKLPTPSAGNNFMVVYVCIVAEIPDVHGGGPPRCGIAQACR